MLGSLSCRNYTRGEWFKPQGGEAEAEEPGGKQGEDGAGAEADGRLVRNGREVRLGQCVSGAGCRLWALFLTASGGRPPVAHRPGSLFLAQLLQQPPNLHLSGPPGTIEIFKLQSTFLII